MSKKQALQDIQNKLVSGFNNWKDFGYIQAKTQGDMTLFCYTAAAGRKNDWNVYEEICRGLILNNKTGAVIARPFDKFFNWFERGKTTQASIQYIQEKADGSLGISHRDPQDPSKMKISTKGSFNSEQAIWATEYLEQNWGQYFSSRDWFWTDYTLLFEIIYPENKIVLDYKGMEGLILLAARDILTGNYMPMYPHLYEISEKYGFILPQIYSFNSTLDIIEATGDSSYEDKEGWVAVFSNGLRFKFKTDRYLELHRIINSISLKNVVKAISEGKIADYFQHIPEEFLDDVVAYRRYVAYIIDGIEEEVEEYWSHLPKFIDGEINMKRKTFAKKVMTEAYHLQKYLFAKLDGKDYKAMLLQSYNWSEEDFQEWLDE